MCQRSVGAASVTWATIRRERLQIVRGTPTWWRSSAAAERGFCPTCGATLFFRPDSGEAIDVSAATFDHPAELAPAMHIWTDSQQPWVHLDPNVPAYPDGGPDGDLVAALVTPPSVVNDIRFQEGGPIDLAQLAYLFQEVGFARRNDPAYLQAAIDGARWVVSAWRGEELVGFARAISDGVSNAYVSTVAVRPDHQRRGIGRALMERLLAGRATVKFVLHTRPAGAGLYRSFGFVDATEMLVRPRSE
jgi:ribosomal protein S18 acetylase RimI-like enzyme